MVQLSSMRKRIITCVSGEEKSRMENSAGSLEVLNTFTTLKIISNFKFKISVWLILQNF
jgi:hypothetical protein